MHNIWLCCLFLYYSPALYSAETPSPSLPKFDGTRQGSVDDSIAVPVIVDDMQELLSNMTQHSASWLDDISYNDQVNEEGSARGYLKWSWIPRSGDVGKTAIKFKIKLHLPKWNDRLSLLLDNDDEGEIKTDYESEPPLRINDNEPVNIAVQYIKDINNSLTLKNRLGVSRAQLYLRSELQFYWQYKKLDFSLAPRIDYYVQDGWGPGTKSSARYSLPDDQFSLSASWQKIETESKSRRKYSFYHIKQFSSAQMLISGIKYQKDITKLNLAHSSYLISTRFRKLFHKTWLFYEIEPFIEFNQSNNYQREYGAILSLFTYYGKSIKK